MRTDRSLLVFERKCIMLVNDTSHLLVHLSCCWGGRRLPAIAKPTQTHTHTVVEAASKSGAKTKVKKSENKY